MALIYFDTSVHRLEILNIYLTIIILNLLSVNSLILKCYVVSLGHSVNLDLVFMFCNIGCTEFISPCWYRSYRYKSDSRACSLVAMAHDPKLSQRPLLDLSDKARSLILHGFTAALHMVVLHNCERADYWLFSLTSVPAVLSEMNTQVVRESQ